jgi:hypothetical protein
MRLLILLVVLALAACVPGQFVAPPYTNQGNADDTSVGD